MLSITNLLERFWFLLNLRQGRRKYIDVLSKYLEIHGTIAGNGSEVGLLNGGAVLWGLGVSGMPVIRGILLCRRWAMIVCAIFFYRVFF